MAFLKSIIFNILFYAWVIFFSLTMNLLLLFMPHKVLVAYINFFFKGVQFLERSILNLHFKILHKERIPKGCCILAIKHQSAWETLKLYELAEDPVVIYKRELGWIPFFGWIFPRMEMIAVDRSKGKTALQSMLQQAKKLLKKQRPLVIFPQGTRVPIGVKKPYKKGVAALYKEMNVPVVPIAINAGYFWPKNSFIKKSGTITISVLEPIQPGLSQEELLKKLEEVTEKECERLAKLIKA